MECTANPRQIVCRLYRDGSDFSSACESGFTFNNAIGNLNLTWCGSLPSSSYLSLFVISPGSGSATWNVLSYSFNISDV
jgi:hypothetical protein